MSDDEINPFQAPMVETPVRPIFVDAELKPKSLVRVAVKWTLICAISAAPSFVVAMWATGSDAPVSAAAGMLMAIFLFICAYTYAEMTPFFRRLMLDPRKKRAAKITYGIRVGVSIVFPVGIYLDFMIGILSVGLMSGLLGDGATPINRGQSFSPLMVAGWHFITTIVDGLIMNFVVFGLMLIVFGICVLAMQRPQYVPPGASKNVP